MAAALPGVIAANTTLPVIGVPVKGSVLDGVDALYSIIQMPPGIPVATVASGFIQLFPSGNIRSKYWSHPYGRLQSYTHTEYDKHRHTGYRSQRGTG